MFPDGPLKTRFEKILFSNRRISETNFYNGTPCWEWTGKVNGDAGYGCIYYGNTRESFETTAHRLAAKLYLADYTKELLVLHHCDNPPCFNPAHLFMGTKADNIRDAYNKKRFIHPNGLKTHCPRGHPFNEENTKVTSKGRYCKKCNVIRKRICVQKKMFRRRIKQ